MHSLEFLGDVGQVKSHFFPFEDSVIVGADRCMVCARCTTVSKIVLDALDGTSS
jgi:hypothetical protein